MKLDPFIEVITNIEDDHLDYYKSFDNIVAAFSDFMAKVPDAGVAVVCYDNPVIRELLKGYKRPYLTYAVDCLEADYTLQNVCFNGQATAGDVWERGNYWEPWS